MTVRNQIFLISAVPLLFLAAVLYVGLMLSAQTSRGALLAQHTADLLAKADAAYEVINDANRAVQTYTRTHDRKAFDAYAAVKAEAPRRFQSLLQAVPGDGREAKLVRAYVGYLEQIFPLIDEYIGFVKAGKMKDAMALAARPSVQALGRNLLSSKTAVDDGARADSLAQVDTLRVQRATLGTVLVVLTALGITLTFALSASLGLRMTRRLHHLVENADLLSHRDPTFPLQGKDEFSDVDRATHQLARRLEDSMALQVALVAQRLPETPNLRLDSVYVPAATETEVGGDWYDMFEITKDVIGISIGDVVGHGLHAASTMAAMREAIRVAARSESDPSAVISSVNRSLCIDEPGVIATALVATLDMTTGLFRWSVAGHPPPLLVRPDSGLSVLEGKGLVLGFDPASVYDDYAVSVTEGCALVLYTDGFVELEREYFKGLRTLQAAVIEAYDDATSANPADAIRERIFAGKQPRDDAALLFIGVSKIGEPAFDSRHVWHFDARNSAQARRTKRAVLWKLAGLSGGSAPLEAFELVYGELLANVARHTPGPAKVSLEMQDRSAILTVEDEGQPFSVPVAPVLDPLAESGRGYWLISQFSEAVSIERTGRGNRVMVSIGAAANRSLYPQGEAVALGLDEHY